MKNQNEKKCLGFFTVFSTYADIALSLLFSQNQMAVLLDVARRQSNKNTKILVIK